VFYDPALNKRTGFTEAGSALFEIDGHIRSAVTTMTTFDPAILQSIADSCNIQLKAASDENVVYTPASAIAPTPDSTPPTEPTPRPVEVAYRIISHGSSIAEWENGG
jgi:hypothetical protein